MMYGVWMYLFLLFFACFKRLKNSLTSSFCFFAACRTKASYASRNSASCLSSVCIANSFFACHCACRTSRWSAGACSMTVFIASSFCFMLRRNLCCFFCAIVRILVSFSSHTSMRAFLALRSFRMRRMLRRLRTSSCSLRCRAESFLLRSRTSSPSSLRSTKDLDSFFKNSIEPSVSFLGGVGTGVGEAGAE